MAWRTRCIAELQTPHPPRFPQHAMAHVFVKKRKKKEKKKKKRKKGKKEKKKKKKGKKEKIDMRKKRKKGPKEYTRDGPKKLIFHIRTVKRNRNEIEAQKKIIF